MREFEDRRQTCALAAKIVDGGRLRHEESVLCQGLTPILYFSSADYEEYLEPVDMTIDIKRRRFEIEVDRETFLALNVYAKKVNQPVKSLASSILKKNIASF